MVKLSEENRSRADTKTGRRSSTDTHSPFLLGKKVRSVIEPLLLRTNREQSRYFTTVTHQAAEPGSTGDDNEPRREKRKGEDSDLPSWLRTGGDRNSADVTNPDVNCPQKSDFLRNPDVFSLW